METQSTPRPIIQEYIELIKNSGIDGSILDAIKNCRKTDALGETIDYESGTYNTRLTLDSSNLYFADNPILGNIGLEYSFNPDQKVSKLEFTFLTGFKFNQLELTFSMEDTVDKRIVLESIKSYSFHYSSQMVKRLFINMIDQRVKYQFKKDSFLLSLIYVLDKQKKDFQIRNNLTDITLGMYDTAHPDNLITDEKLGNVDYTLSGYQFIYSDGTFTLNDVQNNFAIERDVDVILDLDNLDQLMIKKITGPIERD